MCSYEVVGGQILGVVAFIVFDRIVRDRSERLESL